jgi:hypothetical protein
MENNVRRVKYSFAPSGFKTLFFSFMVSFLSQKVSAVFIKTKIVPPSKFYLKLNGISHQHQSNIVTCYIINLKKIKKLYLKKMGVANPLAT